MDLDGVDERERDAPFSREAGATGEALSTGPAVREDANGERRLVSPSVGRESSGGAGFTTVNDA